MQIIIRLFALSAQLLEIAPDLGFRVGGNPLAFNGFRRLLHGSLESAAHLRGWYFLESPAPREAGEYGLPGLVRGETRRLQRGVYHGGEVPVRYVPDARPRHQAALPPSLAARPFLFHPAPLLYGSPTARRYGTLAGMLESDRPAPPEHTLMLLPAYLGTDSIAEAIRTARGRRMLWLEILVNDRLDLGPCISDPAVQAAYRTACR